MSLFKCYTSRLFVCVYKTPLYLEIFCTNLIGTNLIFCYQLKLPITAGIIKISSVTFRKYECEYGDFVQNTDYEERGVSEFLHS